MKKKEYSPESDFNVSYDGRSLVITACSDKTSREILVPPLINGRPVTEIGNGAFTFCHELRRIVLPDTVTSIDNAAFRGCRNLVDAVLSKELRSIGALSFAGCLKLRRVTLGNCLERFEMNSFRECPELREIVIWHREKGEYMSFAVSSEEDVAIWLYLRGVLSATAPHGAYMDKYDATFLEIKGEYDVYNIAVSRLRNPVDLSPERRQIYENALSGAVPQIIRQDRVDQLTAIGELGCIKEDALDEYIHTASRIGGGCIAYLLEYKHRIGKSTGYDFSL